MSDNNGNQPPAAAPLLAGPGRDAPPSRDIKALQRQVITAILNINQGRHRFLHILEIGSADVVGFFSRHYAHAIIRDPAEAIEVQSKYADRGYRWLEVSTTGFDKHFDIIIDGNTVTTP
jgi:hypothetical protein